MNPAHITTVRIACPNCKRHDVAAQFITTRYWLCPYCETLYRVSPDSSNPQIITIQPAFPR